MIEWLPPIVTGIHVVIFGVLTYLGHRHRKQFMRDVIDERKTGLAEATERIVALFSEDDGK